MAALLLVGDVHRRYPSRSEVVQALALAACNAGWSLEDLCAALIDPRNLGGERVQEILDRTGEDAARRYVASSWRKAEAKRLADPPVRQLDDEDALMVERVAEAARLAGWKGIAGSTDSAVMAAHVEIARRRGSVVHGASVREIAERAGIAYPTASKSQRRLINAGWLTRLERGEGQAASTWILALPEPHRAQVVNTPPAGGGVRKSVNELHVAHDAFRHRALGKNGFRVLAALAVMGSADADQLRAALALHPATIRRHLLRLEALGLAVRDEHGRWSALPGDLDAVARRLGTAGKGSREKILHKKQRDAYRLTSCARRGGLAPRCRRSAHRPARRFHMKKRGTGLGGHAGAVRSAARFGIQRGGRAAR